MGIYHYNIDHLHLNIGKDILCTVLHVFAKVLTRRICVTINNFFS